MVYKKGIACEYLLSVMGGPIHIKDLRRGVTCRELKERNMYNIKGGGEVDDHLIVIGKQ